MSSMDETIGQDAEQDSDVTLHDCLAGHGESADQVAACPPADPPAARMRSGLTPR